MRFSNIPNVLLLASQLSGCDGAELIDASLPECSVAVPSLIFDAKRKVIDDELNALRDKTEANFAQWCAKGFVQPVEECSSTELSHFSPAQQEQYQRKDNDRVGAEIEALELEVKCAYAPDEACESQQ